ncbi:hypothetical protein METHB2_830004 [Candidatus Methylobacter favarea]|uniref:Uncharacterized protein n=1 Tax=Candidatus Methylobacter favarea TaxID=2707345 RepID=A0A8S0YAZ3_9GAMM|nr:hypothetical protein METHB2_830004 [Candidatus Methylobacter favarea]
MAKLFEKFLLYRIGTARIWTFAATVCPFNGQGVGTALFTSFAYSWLGLIASIGFKREAELNFC